MYKPIEGGSVVEIQGLQCNLPPVGYVYNRITHELDYIGVYRRSSIDAECYWEVPQSPVWYKEVMRKWDAYDKIKKEDEVKVLGEAKKRRLEMRGHRRVYRSRGDGGLGKREEMIRKGDEEKK